MTPTSPPRDVSVTAPGCLHCHRPLTGNARRYCSPACRTAGWRRRTTPQLTPPPLPPTRSRRDGTIYECQECGTRYLAHQWCDECAQPCQRLGAGGPCPHCDELLTIQELLAAAGLTPPTAP